jgi:hypothetical protein
METLLVGIGLALLALLGAPLFTIIGAIAMLSFTAEGIDSSADRGYTARQQSHAGGYPPSRLRATCWLRARP